MRLRKQRTAARAFLLTFILGLAFYALTQERQEVRAQQPRETAESLVRHELGMTVVVDYKITPEQFVRYVPLKSLKGYSNTGDEIVTLRESPRKNSRVVAKVRTGGYRNADILDSTRDFLRVRFNADADFDEDNKARDYEGWAAWGDVLPNAAAIVLDTATGEVVSRMALPSQGEESGQAKSVAYSPDGSRAVFYSYWSGEACEVNTSDYTLKRSLLISDSLRLEAMFYGPVDGELYAVTGDADQPRSDQNTQLSLLRVSTEEAAEPARQLSGAATGFVVSRDGRTGIMTHEAESGSSTYTLDVFDLETMTVRNTLILDSASPLTMPGMIVINRDASKLYMLESDEKGQQVISVVETGTGKRLPDLKLGETESGWEGLMPDSIVGDAVFSRVWNQETENESAQVEMPSTRGLWVDADGRAAAQQGIAYAIEAGDARLGLDLDGTQLFKLDEKNRIHQRFKIERPEKTEGAGIYNIVASPDGKRLILFTGPVYGC